MEVLYQDMGLKDLSTKAERYLGDVLDITARAVEREMKLNIINVNYVDTRATLNSVQVDPPQKPLERDIGPTTHYAIYGEMGYHQTHAWGRKMKVPVYHPALHFARDALFSQKQSFIRAINRAMKKLGRRG